MTKTELLAKIAEVQALASTKAFVNKSKEVTDEFLTKLTAEASKLDDSITSTPFDTIINTLSTEITNAPQGCNTCPQTILDIRTEFDNSLEQVALIVETPATAPVTPAPETTRPSQLDVIPTAPATAPVAPAPETTRPSQLDVIPTATATAPETTRPSQPDVIPTAPAAAPVVAAPKTTVAPQPDVITAAPVATVPETTATMLPVAIEPPHHIIMPQQIGEASLHAKIVDDNFQAAIQQYLAGRKTLLNAIDNKMEAMQAVEQRLHDEYHKASAQRIESTRFIEDFLKNSRDILDAATNKVPATNNSTPTILLNNEDEDEDEGSVITNSGISVFTIDYEQVTHALGDVDMHNSNHN